MRDLICPYICDNKTEYGYCKTTTCINPEYNKIYTISKRTFFTQDIDYYKVLKQIKVEVAKEIFEKIEKLTYRLLNDADYTMGDIVYDITELKNKYIGEKEDAEIY